MGILKNLFNAFANPPKPQSQPRMQNDSYVKEVKHKVAGVTHYKDNILSFARPNPQYGISKKEMIAKDIGTIYEYAFVTGKTELIPEPTNPSDPNAIMVVIDGKHVGYIKKGSCKHILNLMEQNRIENIDSIISGGKCKCLEFDGEGNTKLSQRSKEYSVTVLITEQ